MSSLAEVVASNRGMTVSQYQREVVKRAAKRAGLSVADYLNQNHPYRKHRKEYCENRDGRLGYKCRYKIRISAQLEVDHINGNPKDNREENLQTLCNNCHCYKTHMNKDYATPGRKSLKKGLFTSLV
jgi:5-methylcytosine-specific restriction endonuclease McrA